MSAIGSLDGGATVVGDEAGDIERWVADVAEDVSVAVNRELRRQAEKWGTQDHPREMWHLIIAEEDGEAAQAILQGRFLDAQKELVQSIACRIRLIEKLRRAPTEGAVSGWAGRQTSRSSVPAASAAPCCRTRRPASRPRSPSPARRAATSG